MVSIEAWPRLASIEGNTQLKSSVTAVVALIAILLFISFRLARDNDDAVPYSVEIPEPCLDGWQAESEEKQFDDMQIAHDTPSESFIRCHCPGNGKFLGAVPADKPHDIDLAVSKAGAAQGQWARTSFGQRRRVLNTLLRYILDHQEVIATAACLDTGKTKIDGFLGEVLVTAEKLKWTVLHGEKALMPERRPTNLLLAYKVNEVRWEPLGVVAACVSWNYPFHNVVGPVISALFAGNAIVVKGSEQTAWSTRFFIEIARSALEACGHSADLIQSIVCWPDAASYLTAHPGIAHLTFIGSRRVGRLVAAAAADNLIPVCMELGGKDAAIVLDDTGDLDKVSSIIMRGVFQSAGQNCIGIERVVACSGVYDGLVEMLRRRIELLRVGDALEDEKEGRQVDVGAAISDANFDELERLVDEAVASGATCLVGGRRHGHPAHTRGHYFSPSLLVDVAPEMRIARQETFAPVCLLMKAVDVDDAIRIANSTEYGLGASVFGTSPGALERVVSRVQAGMVSVNDFAVYYAVQLPFGGVKGSGHGRFAGEEGLRSLCNTKAVCRDRFPRVISTSIPRALDYPIPDAAAAWAMCTGILDFAYGDTLPRRLRGLGKIVWNG